MPEDYGIELPGRPGSDDMFLTAIVIPESAGEPVSRTETVTRFSQMDINGHMNNASYFDMIDDAVWNDVSSGRTTDSAEAAAVMPKPKALYINYINELPAGTRLTLNEYKAGGDVYFEGADDKPYFRVKITY
jgi:acyl-ACP thioesterase